MDTMDASCVELLAAALAEHSHVIEVDVETVAWLYFFSAGASALCGGGRSGSSAEGHVLLAVGPDDAAAPPEGAHAILHNSHFVAREALPTLKSRESIWNVSKATGSMFPGYQEILLIAFSTRPRLYYARRTTWLLLHKSVL